MSFPRLFLTEEAMNSALHLAFFSRNLLMFRTYKNITVPPIVHRRCASRVGIPSLLMVLPSEAVRVMHHLSTSSFSLLFEADRGEDCQGTDMGHGWAGEVPRYHQCLLQGRSWSASRLRHHKEANLRQCSEVAPRAPGSRRREHCCYVGW